MLATWPKTALSTKLPGTPIHSSAMLPLLLMMMHIRLWTFILALVFIVVLTVMRQKGRTITWMFRRLKSNLRGGRVAARPVFYVRRMSRIEGFDTLQYPVQKLHVPRAPADGKKGGSRASTNAKPAPSGKAKAQVKAKR